MSSNRRMLGIAARFRAPLAALEWMLIPHTFVAITCFQPDLAAAKVPEDLGLSRDERNFRTFYHDHIFGSALASGPIRPLLHTTASLRQLHQRVSGGLPSVYPAFKICSEMDSKETASRLSSLRETDSSPILLDNRV